MACPNRSLPGIDPIRSAMLTVALLSSAISALPACNDPDAGTNDEDEDDDVSEGPDDGSTPSDRVRCEDKMVLDLGFVEGDPSTGIVTNASVDGGFASTIDATAGGLVNAASNPWIYMRFTDSGLQTVAIDDFEALNSTDWHIAAKRYEVRLNSGTGGPGAVTGAPLDGFSFEEVTEAPSDVTLVEESFYTDDCVLIDDGAGLGDPRYLLTPWWSYPGCVATTRLPFLIRPPEGDPLKFVVESYYGEDQTRCNEEGVMGTEPAQFLWRWTFLP